MLNNITIGTLALGGLLHLAQRGGDWAGWPFVMPLFAVSIVTVHPSRPVYRSS